MNSLKMTAAIEAQITRLEIDRVEAINSTSSNPADWVIETTHAYCGVELNDATTYQVCMKNFSLKFYRGHNFV